MLLASMALDKQAPARFGSPNIAEAHRLDNTRSHMRVMGTFHIHSPALGALCKLSDRPCNKQSRKSTPCWFINSLHAMQALLPCCQFAPEMRGQLGHPLLEIQDIALRSHRDGVAKRTKMFCVVFSCTAAPTTSPRMILVRTRTYLRGRFAL